MTEATSLPPRIATLDIVRGVAVMGILAMNIVAFAMPFQTYLNPMAMGPISQADFASWLVSFILVDGKMRGLFSFLFGASMLLVIERADAKGEDPATIHYRRMLWLLAFGLIHLFLIWFGDILTAYALVGMIAWFFRRMGVRKLIVWGVLLSLVQFLVFAGMAGASFALEAAASQPDASPSTLAEWKDLQLQLGVLTGAPLAEKLAIYGGGYGGILADRFENNALEPITGLIMFGWETLSYFVFGMAAFRSGFLTGRWSASAYRRTALIGFGIGIPAYGLLALLLVRDEFGVPTVLACVLAAPVLFRPLMVVATAALIILLSRPGGALTERIAAAGRAAFTNYLGTSLVMTTLFYGYGLGLFGKLGRAELWIPVLLMWALMLLWSKPWLDRFRYGPFEWLWRSLARWELQPMRKDEPAAAPAA